MLFNSYINNNFINNKWNTNYNDNTNLKIGFTSSFLVKFYQSLPMYS